MLVGKSVKEVSPLTVKCAMAMHHVMSLDLVTMCPDTTVNRVYPGNQEGGVHR